MALLSGGSAARLACVLALGLIVAGCGGGTVTKANYDKINNGMSVKDVEAILGAGKEQASTGVSIPSAGAGGVNFPGMSMSSKVLTWQDGNKTISVTFMNDKVMLKVHSGL